MGYDRERAAAYAHKWAFGRNPAYYDFTDLGGDCTNFISQCIFAGCGVMNFTPFTGWYYTSPDSRSAAWTSVVFLHDFLVTNGGVGPFGREIPLELAQPGDVIQLDLWGTGFVHCLMIVQAGRFANPGNILIAAHSTDSDNRLLNTYNYLALRLIRIEGARL